MNVVISILYTPLIKIHIYIYIYMLLVLRKDLISLELYLWEWKRKKGDRKWVKDDRCQFFRCHVSDGGEVGFEESSSLLYLFQIMGVEKQREKRRCEVSKRL